MSIVAILLSSWVSQRPTNGQRLLLSFLRCPLRCLQRINRRRTRESAALSRRLLRLGNHQISPLRPGHAALDHQQVLFFVHAQHAQVTHRHLGVPHMPRHAHSLEHTRWKCRRSNRTGYLEHRSMRLRAAAEVMPLDHPLKPASLADDDDVHKLFALKNLNQHTRANLQAVAAITVALERHFAQEFHRRKIVLRQVSALRLGQPRLLHKFNQADLSGLVTVLRGRLMLRNHAGPCLQHRDRANIALGVEQLRHADFLAQNPCNLDCHFLIPRPAWLVDSSPTATGWSCSALAGSQPPGARYLCSFPNALISTSTPAGKSSFIKASTVCCVGSRMSSRRLCVRISNCSRDFLSTCGDRSTQYLSFIVGNGIGPAICAPVRRAVSTISPVDWSRMREGGRFFTRVRFFFFFFSFFFFFFP